jgi:hypothetical protein
VAGFGFRTIGRLVFNHSFQPTHFNEPISITTPINHSQSTVAGFGFRTIGRLVKQVSTSTHHLDQPLQQTTSSLTVAGLLASGQSADWSINPLHPTTTINYPFQST